MKDIVITAGVLRRELWVLLGCFVLSYGCNIFAIIHYHRPAIELISTIGYVIFLMVLIYLILLIVRLLLHFVKNLVGKGN